MDVRDQRAILIAATCQSIDRKGGTWLVPSQSTSGRTYHVRLEGDGSCNCADHAEGYRCKHIRAARIILKRELGHEEVAAEVRAAVSDDTRLFEAKKKDNRDHAAFNEAQAVEKHRVQVLLLDLLRKVEEPECKKCGRKPHSIKDAIFSMVMKVYGTKASRTTSCDLLDAHKNGYLSKPIPGMKLSSFFENPAYTPSLKALVAFSALPLRVVETKFAVDSTGFPNTKSENWFDYQKGVTRRRTIWTKAPHRLRRQDERGRSRSHSGQGRRGLSSVRATGQAGRGRLLH